MSNYSHSYYSHSVAVTTTQLNPRKKPRQERARQTVDAILEAAAQVFERHGYAAGTTNRIAERAGISIGSLYQYFPNKDSVLVAIIERHIDEGVAVMGPLFAELHEAPPPPHAGFARMMETMLELHRGRPDLHRVLFEEAPRPLELQRRLEELTTTVVAGVAAYLRARPEVTTDPEITARLTVQVIESVTHNLVIHPTTRDRTDDYAAATVEMLAAYATRA
jgi:AcrR family transcriptional regulator